MTDETPDWVLERYHLGELTGPRKTALEAALKNDPALQARLDALEASDAEILRRYPSRVIEAHVQTHAVASARPGRRWVWLAAPALMAAVALVALSVSTSTSVAPDPDGEVRLKGGEAFLRVFHDEGRDASELSTGAYVAPGDTVQIAYVGGEQTFGAILSVDGRGSVSQHWPTSGNQAAALEDAPSVLLPTALKLDDAPEFERFFFVTSSEPFSLDSVHSAVGQLAHGPSPQSADLQLSNTLEQASFLLLKEVQP